jgi:hypothetical protein
MKTQRLNLFLIVLVCILIVALALNCQGTPSANGNSEWDWHDCPAGILADNMAVRVEDLPLGWNLSYVQAEPNCGFPFRLFAKAVLEMRFEDQKPWNDPRRSLYNMICLRWEEEAVACYFDVPDDWQAVNITWADEAYLSPLYTQAGDPAANCTCGAALKFRKGLYEVTLSSWNWDLVDLCIEEGPEVDAEVAFVTDLATKVASRIP